MVYTAIMGYGTIGSGVFEVLRENRAEIAAAAGQELEVKYVLDLRDFPGDPAEEKLVHDVSVIVNDPEVRIVVETMGGLDPAYPFVKACLEAGKHVATSNKALVAAYGTELLAVAREHHVNFMFEASTGGGIPIIRMLYRCLAGEKISAVTGILNGTTNYILTKMDRDGEDFCQALKEAQRLGYAEKDPTADVEGYDTCRKLAILMAMVTGREVDYQEIYTEGITEVQAGDFLYARAMGRAIKLVGSACLDAGRLSAWVVPMLVKPDNPLCGVGDVYNAILVRSNMLGTSMYYGSGAGKLPTASAVAADMIEAAAHLDEHVPLGWSAEKLSVESAENNVCRYFLRITGRPEACSGILESYLGSCGTVTVEELAGTEFAVMTAAMREGDFREAEKKLRPELAAAGCEIVRILRAE